MYVPVLLSSWMLAGAAALRGQAAGDRQVVRVEFWGVRSVPRDQVLLVVKTKATYCRLSLLAPVCAVARNQFFVRKHVIEPGQLEEDVVRLRAFYWKHGFREARVDTIVAPRRRGVAVTFVGSEGPPTLVDSLVVAGGGASLPAGRVERAVGLRPGAPLDVAALDTGLITVRDALWDAGYADALVASDTHVDDDRRRATVRITVDPRWPTRVGSITVRGNDHLSADAVRRALAFRPGDLFRRRDVMASQRHLYKSLLLESAVIVLPPEGDSLKRVEVAVRERKPQRAGVTVGASTVEFVQVGARAGFFALGGGARQLDLRLAVGNLFARPLNGVGPFADVLPGDDAERALLRPTWQGSAELAQLWAGSPRNRIAIGAFAHRRSEPAVFVDRGYGAMLSFAREVAERALAAVTYRVERATVEAGDVYFCQYFGLCDVSTAAAMRRAHRLAPLAVSAWLDRGNNVISPSRGFQLRLEAEHASAATASEFRHTRAALDAAAYRPVGAAVLAGRVRGGWVGATGGSPGGSAPGEPVLHPRALFYSGGGESVRGYGENQLGPRVLRVARQELLARGCTDATLADGSCDPNVAPSGLFSPRPVGARTLLEGSVELRASLSGPFGAVLFADAAVVGRGSLAGSRGAVSAVTPGAGLRYTTNVGVLRLDAGYRTGGRERLPVVVETRAPDGTTRVIRLTTPMSYDAAEGRGGGARRALRRVAVHLSLGHAF